MTPPEDKRNRLRIAPEEGGVDASQVESARRRLAENGGELSVWGVLYEDLYESRYGDGFYLSLRGIALNETDAHRLAACASPSDMTRWHVRGYLLRLEDDLPRLATGWRAEEEFSITDVVRMLGEIAPGETTSKLLTGSGAEGRCAGPHLLSLR